MFDINNLNDTKTINAVSRMGIKPLDTVKHFKRELATEDALLREPNLYTYTILAFAKDCDTLEDVVVYVAKYNNPVSKVWVRKAKDFFAEVDHHKYPEVKQKYVYELI